MFTSAEIGSIVGSSGPMPHPDMVVQSVSTDSRQINHGGQACFIALRGLRHDGHHFLKQAWHAGVRNFIVEEHDPQDLPDSNIFIVENVVHALQALAAAHRKKFTFPCIGITGSNGKTWVKEWLYQLLTPDHFIVKSPRSYNSQIGVPLSVLQMRREHTLGIIEAGISVRGEMQRLAAVIQPDIGILTHLGDAHQAGFSDLTEKLVEKLQLFQSAKTVIYCSDEPWVASTVRETCQHHQLLTWNSLGAEADLQATQIEISEGWTWIKYSYRASVDAYRIPFTDQASIRNSLTCCLVMLHLGYSGAMIRDRMAGLHAIAMRLAIHHLPGNSVLINDAYSLDMGSLAVALETLHQHSAGMTKTLIISDIDKQHAASYQGIAARIAQHEIDHVLAIGADIGELASMLPPAITYAHFRDMQTFIQAKPWVQFLPGAFLLKGARSFHFEQLAEHMQGRYHSAVLEIDLNALLSNLQFFVSRLESQTRIIAMVKAAAYGTGGAEIARFLAFHNVFMLTVAYIDEGIDLRESGVRTRILVMNPDPAMIHQLDAYALEPEVYDLNILEAMIDYSTRYPEKAFDVHLKVDTGMHRLGFSPDDASLLIRRLREAPQIRVASVFTHLAAAGDPDARDFTLGQVAAFDLFYAQFAGGIGYRPMRHVLNTKGALHFPEFQYEAVRLGIGIYGAGAPEMAGQLQPVHTLRARLSQIHEIVAGDSVGYDRAFVADKPMRIGTINVGYADGLRRCAGNEKYTVLIHDRPATILGKVCMDMTMVDLTGHPEASPGDDVIIFGQHHPIDALAQVCDTNAYEILTGISQRIPRVFLYS